MIWLRRHADVVSCLVLLAVFRAFPGIDLAVERLFHDPAGGFIHARSLFVMAVKHGVTWAAVATFAAVGVLAVLAIVGWARARRHGRTLAFLVLSLVLGPWLAVNVGFKDHMGRPRPEDVRELGGDTAYVPVLQPSGYCSINCSFPSGHAGFGFWFATLGIRFRRHRFAFLGGGIAAGAVFGLGRMMQGKHFLSDVVFAFYVVWFVARLVAAALDRLVPRTPGAQPA